MNDFKEHIKTLIDDLEDPATRYFRECRERGESGGEANHFGPYHWDSKLSKKTFRVFLTRLSQFIEKGEDENDI